MRVAMVSEHASPLAVLGGVDAGGQNVHVASLAAQMAKRGAEVIVYTRRDHPTLPRRVAFCRGVWVEHVDAGPPWPIPKDDIFPHVPQFAAALREAWRAERHDVVHAHFWMSGMAALEAGRPLGIPVVQTFHALGVVKRRYQGGADTSPAQRIKIEEQLVRSLDHVVATSTDEVFELMRMGADLERTSIVPCGVDMRLFRPDGPVEPRREGLHRIVVVSRLVPRKGIADVITALGRIPKTELLIAGGPEGDLLEQDEEARRLSRLAAVLGVADRVRLLGRLERPHVAALMRSADVIVSVPWYEPFGIVPVEAMACGTPVVASAVGGHVDTVVDGVTGLHVPPRAPERLAEVLNALVRNPALRERMGAAGARRARERYGWNRIAQSTLATYDRVLADHFVQAGTVAR